MNRLEARYATWLDEFIDSHEDLKTSTADFGKEVHHASQQQIARSIRGIGGR